MRSDELKRQLDAIPGHREALDRELPGRAIALAVARFRADHDLTQEELAQRLGSSQSAIARIESGRHASGSKILNQISQAFGMRWRIEEEIHDVHEAVRHAVPLGPPAGGPDTLVISGSYHVGIEIKSWEQTRVFAYSNVRDAKIDMASALEVLRPARSMPSRELQYDVIRTKAGEEVPMSRDANATAGVESGNRQPALALAS